MAQVSKFICDKCGRSNRNGERAYSEFHRSYSLSRWVPKADADQLANINMDQVLWIECHHRSFEPVALVETAQDIGQSQKKVSALVNLAKRASLPAFLVLYTLDDVIDLVTKEMRINGFRVKQLWAGDGPPVSNKFYSLSNEGYARWLVKFRTKRQGLLLKDFGRPDANDHRRNHDIPRLERLQDRASDQLDWCK